MRLGAPIPSCPLRAGAPRDGDEVSAMPGEPPILEQARDETVFVVSPRLQIPVVLEHSKYVVDRHGTIAHRPGPGLLAIEVHGSALEHTGVDGGLGQQSERGPIAIGSEHQFQPALVVIEIRLPANAEHLAGVHAFDVVERGTAPTVQAQTLVQAVEKPLHVVGNETAQPAAHLLTRGEGQVEPASLRERGKAGESCLLVQGFRSRGEKMFACALSPAWRRIGSRPMLPDRIRHIRCRWS